MQFIHNQWLAGTGEAWTTYNPATGLTHWEGTAAGEEQIEQAVNAAQNAFAAWSLTRLEKRISILEKYAQLLQDNQLKLAESISEEVGKPLWESKAEVTTMVNKIHLSIEAYYQRTSVTEKPITGGIVVTKHIPIGVMAILGPFNFPGHLPHGQIVPALLAGNTIVFKPSEYTPKTSIMIVELWQIAGLPAGVLNMVLGKGEIGQKLSMHPEINGILFTGSYATGKKLHAQCAGLPEKLLALEMGGNNPLIVWDVKDKDAAAYHIIQSAFITAGQRCTCARRLIISNDEEADDLLAALKSWMKRLTIGYWRDQPEPFMGPVISVAAAQHCLEKQNELLKKGGKALVMMSALNTETGLLSPGLIDVTDIKQQEDEEIFGPLLQVIRVADFENALKVANQTQYGLVAGLQSDHQKHYHRFTETVKAGVLNWNRPTTGATSVAPFGGLGHSGNHRPGGYYTADYCVYPVASNETETLTLPSTLTPGFVHQ